MFRHPSASNRYFASLLRSTFSASPSPVSGTAKALVRLQSPARNATMVAAPKTMASSALIGYEWIDGVETLEEYAPGGYHPVLIGDTLRDRYEIVDKLGYGGYSTTWLAHDRQHSSYVAVKVGVSDSSLPQSDVPILSKLSHPCLPKILDHFDIKGPNGTHPCYTMAPAQGNLNDALSRPMFPVRVSRILAAKLVLAVNHIHSHGYVHGDLQIRNMLIKNTAYTLDTLSISKFREKYHEPDTVRISRVDGQPLTPNVPAYAVLPTNLGKAARDFTPEDARGFLLADFGEAFSPTNEIRLGRDSHTPLPGRAPETFFEPDLPLSFPSDIWTMGTAIWEILGMKFPFSQHVPVDELIAQHIDMLGYEDFPPAWRKTWERQGPDEPSDMPRVPDRHPNDKWPPLERAWEEFNQNYRRKRQKTGIFSEEESRAILDLMRGMFRFKPEKRLTAAEVLESEWMVKWVLPQLEGGA